MSKLSTLTFKEFEGQVRADTGATDYSDPSSDLIMRWTNVILQKIALLTAPIDNPWGRNSSTLSNLNGTGIYRTTAVFDKDTLTFTNLSDLDETYVGGWIFWHDPVNMNEWWGLIDSVPSSSSCVLRITGGTVGQTMSDIGSNGVVFAKPNPVFYQGANVTSISYPFIRDIVKVVDATNGNMVRLDGDEFSAISKNPNLTNSVCMQYAGQAVYFGKGSGVSSLGVCRGYYNQTPDVITAGTDAIDLLPEHLPILQSEVMRWVLNYTDKPVSPSVEQPMIALEAMFKKHAEEQAARLKKQDIPAKRV